MLADSYWLLSGFLITSLINLFFWNKKREKFLTKFNYPFLLVIILILGQLVLSFFFKKQVGDVFLFSGAGYHLRHKIDFYWIDSNHTQYPFFPFLIFLFAPLNYLSETQPWFNFSFCLKAVLSLCLVLLSYLICKNPTSRQIDRQKIIWAIRFVSNPITFAIIFYHGQIDVILLTFLIAAIILLKQQSWSQILQSSLLFACSIASKTWSVLILPQVIWQIRSWPKKFIYFLLIVGFLLANIKFYGLIIGSNFETVTNALLAPGGPGGNWGLSLLLKPIWSILAPYRLLIFLSLFGILQLLILLSKKNLLQTALLTILSFYLTTPNWGVQYLFWQIPLIFILASQKKLKVSKLNLILTSLYCLITYLNISLIQPAKFLSTLATLIGLGLYIFYLQWFNTLLKPMDEK